MKFWNQVEINHEHSSPNGARFTIGGRQVMLCLVGLSSKSLPSSTAAMPVRWLVYAIRQRQSLNVD